jgi:hypothetical protein
VVVVVIAFAVIIIQWFAYLQIMKTKPDSFLELWGPDVSWTDAQRIWILVMSFWKMGCWTMALVTLWLTLWSRRLSR